MRIKARALRQGDLLTATGAIVENIPVIVRDPLGSGTQRVCFIATRGGKQSHHAWNPSTDVNIERRSA